MSETTNSPEWMTLTPNEQIVWSGRPSLRAAVGSLVASLLLVGLGLWLETSGVMVGLVSAGQLQHVLPIMLVGFGTLNVVMLLLRHWSVRYVLTTEKVYKKTGMFSCTVRTVWLPRIQHIACTQTIRERLLTYGTIDIETAGGADGGLSLTNVSSPEHTNALLAEHRAASPASEHSSSARDIVGSPAV